MFENDMFIQQKGTAMGRKMAPNYANLYVGLFEKNVIFSPNNSFLRHIKYWKRFIDDVYLLCQGTAKELHRFHSFINTRSEHLKFTLTFDEHETSFLDIDKEGGGKPTDINFLLRGDSFHPTLLKKSLPISQYS
ncbi:unnamed protein product [Coregonus sp. 'balchen']|nr:unnamed protein product [Coregonus sp. 'balchen']